MDLSSLYYVLLMVAGICIIIFVHELGHFLVAKWADVKVEVFSLCFGPSLFQKKVGETVYKIGLIPLGGYVKMTGENPGDKSTGDPREFNSKSVGARAAIISAGVVMNILFACAIFPIVFSLGVKMISPEVGGVRLGSPAWVAGIQGGDRILALNDRSVRSFEDIQFEVALSDGPIKVEYQRDGKSFFSQVTPEYNQTRGFQVIGITPDHEEDTYVRARDESRVEGLEGHSKLLSINEYAGSDLHDRWEELQDRYQGKPEPLILGLEKNGVRTTVRLPGKMVEAKEWFLGVQILRSTRISTVRLQAGKPVLNLFKGDRITRINETPVNDYPAFRKAVLSAPDGPVILKVQRFKEPGTKSVSIPIPALSHKAAREGILENLHFEQGTVVTPMEGYPAMEAGFKAGDRILKIESQEVSSFNEVLEIIRGYNPGKFPNGLAFTLERTTLAPGAAEPTRKTITLRAAPRKRMVNEAWLSVEFQQYHLQEEVKFPFPQSVTKGLRYTGIWVFNIFNTLKSIVTGRVSPKTLGGIITIGKVSYDRAQRGIINLIYFLAILSVNLAIINLLPIPVLDGGHLCFLIVEKIKGSPVSDRVVAVGQGIGLCIILALIVFVTFNDIQRWFIS